jgi:hypothetical protein
MYAKVYTPKAAVAATPPADAADPHILYAYITSETDEYVRVRVNQTKEDTDPKYGPYATPPTGIQGREGGV